MKPLKLLLRFWIGLTSILAFLGGWALLSHANKPAPLFSNTTNNAVPLGVSSASSNIPSLPPIPSLDSLVNNSATTSSSTANILPLPSSPSFSVNNSFTPRFRTGGS